MLSPYTMEREPDELLPTMPAIVAWSTVDVSGPNSRPCGAAAALSAACTTPGWTRARRASGVDLEDAVELEAVDDDAGPDRLPGEAGGGAARDDRQAGRGGGRRHGGEVVRRRRHDDDVGHHAIAGGVGRVEPAPERRGRRPRRRPRARSACAAARPSGESSGMR